MRTHLGHVNLSETANQCSPSVADDRPSDQLFRSSQDSYDHLRDTEFPFAFPRGGVEFGRKRRCGVAPPFCLDMNCSCFDALLSRKKLRQHSEQELVGKNFLKAFMLSHFLIRDMLEIFSYSDLSSATDNFSPDKKIGRGGFGTVYKGTLRNGVAVAIKVLSAESKQGVKEFLTEIDTIANVRHPNLVELIGCCVQDSSRILVYEHMENGSLDRTLLGMNIDKTTKLSWNIRSAICIGTARGLAYLHEDLEPPITWQLFQEGRLKELIDPVLQEYREEQVLKFIKVALFCTQAVAGRRPSMTQVVQMLSQPIRLNEKELTPPGYVEGSSSTRKASEGTISSSTQFKGSTTIDSAAQFTLSPITFTQLVPR
ncbi:hypothetical protein BHM03_00038790 [Ensete ventricosum]|nr:hypothetical protein BHM03_00038790 [Ensete ventricosum]